MTWTAIAPVARLDDRSSRLKNLEKSLHIVRAENPFGLFESNGLHQCIIFFFGFQNHHLKKHTKKYINIKQIQKIKNHKKKTHDARGGATMRAVQIILQRPRQTCLMNGLTAAICHRQTPFLLQTHATLLNVFHGHLKRISPVPARRLFFNGKNQKGYWVKKTRGMGGYPPDLLRDR